MKLYLNPNLDPYFNLAAEEYLITHTREDIIMLWRNDRSVIIGKNQNAFAEIDLEFCRVNGIKVVRRLTGGGAVFHDPGNVNFTFISPAGGQLAEGMRAGGLDFAHFTRPIIAALGDMGIKAELSGRNDIVVPTADGERKISGNAQCVIDGTTMHHGTLLFSAELSRMQGALTVDPEKLKTKGIASVRSRVANIRDLLPPSAELESAELFMNRLAKRLEYDFSVSAESFTQSVSGGIEALAKAKYSTDEWNLRRFGSFDKTSRKRFAFGSLEVALTVRDGVIDNIAFGGDFFGVRDVSELAGILRGVQYTREGITKQLDGTEVGEYISGADAASLLALLL
ncbi:MAG: lipoate--protein ligase [Clostridia bacterium]|nr:lipoate--protein ligase [Clostridia bacterium]MBQ8552564.1 lipoate--protein ligase [Clostridia bacterium]